MNSYEIKIDLQVTKIFDKEKARVVYEFNGKQFTNFYPELALSELLEEMNNVLWNASAETKLDKAGK